MLQVNFKTHGDSLINIYASDPSQLDLALDALLTRLGKIAEVESAFKAGAAIAQALPVTEISTTVAPPQPVAAAPEWAAAAPAPTWGAPAPANAVAAPQCIHGTRTPRSGTGAKGPWKAWFCPTPKGTPNQCDAVWVQKNSPEWNGFPA